MGDFTPLEADSEGGWQAPGGAPFLESRVSGRCAAGGPGPTIWEAREIGSLHLPREMRVLLLGLLLSLSSPLSAIHFPLPMLHFLLSFSKISPKSSFWIPGWSGFVGLLPPHTPQPQLPWPWAWAGELISSGRHSA